MIVVSGVVCCLRFLRVTTNMQQSTTEGVGSLQQFTTLLASTLDHPPFELTMADACSLAFSSGFTHLRLCDIEEAANVVTLRHM